MDEPLANEEINEIEKTLEAVTRGPWGIAGETGKDISIYSEHNDDVCWWWDGDGEPKTEDLLFMATARELVPRLIATVRALQKEE